VVHHRAAARAALFIGFLLCLLATPARAVDLYALPFDWTDDQGHHVRLEQFRGSQSFIAMAYGACRKICSTTLRRMEELQKLTDAQHLDVRFILVSLDPKTDTAEAWREYRHMRHLERSNWTFLSGTDQATRAVAVRLGIGYWLYDDHVLHDFGIALLAPNGEIVRKLTWQDQRLEILLAGLQPAGSTPPAH
jgi:protein SCO1/2